MLILREEEEEEEEERGRGRGGNVFAASYRLNNAVIAHIYHDMMLTRIYSTDGVSQFIADNLGRVVGNDVPTAILMQSRFRLQPRIEDHLLHCLQVSSSSIFHCLT